MKTCVIYFNCHGSMYSKFLKESKNFKHNYDVINIAITEYLDKDKTSFSATHLQQFKNADVLICQFIEKDRGFLGHTNIINNLIKKDCVTILLPHYRSSLYEYYNTVESTKTNIVYMGHIPKNIINLYKESNGDYQIFKDKFMKLTDFVIKKDINKHVTEALEDFKQLEDTQSNINMYEFYKENYKKQRVFGSRPYPRIIFFHEAVRQILYKLNINDLPPYKNYLIEEKNHWNHTLFPIPEGICKLMELDFNCNNEKTAIYKVEGTYQDIQSLYYKALSMADPAILDI